MSTACRRAVAAFTLAITTFAPIKSKAQVAPPELPLGQDDLVRVVDRPEEGILEIVVGPVELPANGPHLRLPLQLITLPIEGWVHGYEWQMRDAGGNALPDRLLHHWNLVNPDKRELFSPVPLRLLAAGRETGKTDISRFLGVPIESGARALVISMFANPTDTPYEEAYLHISMDYTPRVGTWLKPAEVHPFYIDVMGPVGEKDFPLPPGRHARSWEVTAEADGRILALSGHLHNYAERIRIEDVTAGKVLWEAAPEVDEVGEVIGVPTSYLAWRGGIRFYRGHVYRFAVEYVNPTDTPAADGAMGAFGGVLAIRGSEWPELDRYDEHYAQDLRNMLEKPFEAHGHGHGAMGHEMGAGMDAEMDEPGVSAEEAGAADEHRHDPPGTTPR